MSKTTLEMSIETTVMAIREEVMEYFKGTCIEKLTGPNNVRVVALSQPQRGDFYYQRRQAENQRLRMVLIGTTPILTLQKAPDTIIFHRLVMNRSKELREVMQQLEKFAKDYLGAVERSYNNAPIQL